MSLGVIRENRLVNLMATSSPLLIKEGRCTCYVELLVDNWSAVYLPLHVDLVLLDLDLFFRRSMRYESILGGLSSLPLMLMPDIRDREQLVGRT